MSQNIVSKVRTAVNDSQVIVFNLMINCVSAERQFDAIKLGVDLEALPKAARKLVQEKIFPNDFVNNYSRLRDRANAVLERGAAVRVELGVVTSRTEAVAKIKDLNAIKADWATQLEADSHRYTDICNARTALIASQAFADGVDATVVNTLVNALRKRQPTWEDFKSRMNFDYSPVPLTLELDETKSEFDVELFEAQRNGVVALREGVFGGLIQYLTRESNAILKVLTDKRVRRGVVNLNYRTVNRIGEMTEKLHGLSFVHKQILPLALVIDEALRFMPKDVEKDVELPESAFYNLVACLNAMSDQHELLNRLREKQALVEVATVSIAASGQQAQVSAQQATAAAPAVVATSVAATVLEVETSTEDDAQAVASEEVVANTVTGPFMGLSFLGDSLFE